MPGYGDEGKGGGGGDVGYGSSVNNPHQTSGNFTSGGNFTSNNTGNTSTTTEPLKDNKTFFELFPNVSFYDYTKDVNRDITHIPNYHLTFSLNEKNSLLIGLAFKKGMNVTVVIRNKKQGREWLPKPKT